MAQRMTYWCDCCREGINESQHGLLISVQVGHVDGMMHNVALERLPEFLQDLVRTGGRRDLCADCFGAYFMELAQAGQLGAPAPAEPVPTDPPGWVPPHLLETPPDE